jgi:hypothetical protein
MQLVAESGGLALEMRFRHFLAGYRAASFPRLGATYRASDVKSFHGFLLRLKSVGLMRARSLELQLNRFASAYCCEKEKPGEVWPRHGILSASQ